MAPIMLGWLGVALFSVLGVVILLGSRAQWDPRRAYREIIAREVREAYERRRYEAWRAAVGLHPSPGPVLLAPPPCACAETRESLPRSLHTMRTLRASEVADTWIDGRPMLKVG